MKSFFKKHLWDAVLSLILVIFSVGVLVYYFVPKNAGQDTSAYVYINAKVVKLGGKDSLDITTLTSSVKYDLRYADDGGCYSSPHEEGNEKTFVVIDAEPKKIRVEYSDCGNQNCVHTGFIDRAPQCIICAPHKLLVSLVSGNPDEVIV